MSSREQTTAFVAAAPGIGTEAGAGPEPTAGPRQRFSIHRRDRRRATLLTLVGEIDLDSAPELHHAVQECLRAGLRTIDIDLARLTFCDVSGLGAFLDATWLTIAAGGRLRLENLCPMLTRLVALTGTDRLLSIGIDDSFQGLGLGRPGDQ
ncbi:STAS domain-containing protein [Streptacidiphilus sp. PAMC 29251]